MTVRVPLLEEEEVREEVRALLHRAHHPVGGPTRGAKEAVEELRPSPYVFWRFIEELTRWDPRP